MVQKSLFNQTGLQGQVLTLDFKEKEITEIVIILMV